jgi:type IX secretion system PorP/SprF family membrane protein
MKSTFTFFFLLVMLFFVCEKAQAQDPQFSQMTFATPLYLNPAFAGSTSQWRGSVIYRTQWVGVNNASYKSFMASVDHNISSHHNGLGLRVLHDNSGGFTTNMVTGLYAHHIAFKGATLSMGLGITYVSKSLNTSDLLFRDQMRIDTETFRKTQETYGSMTFNMPSFSGGVMFKGGNKYWLGVAVDHINSPGKDLTDQIATLPMKITLHGGLNLLSLNKHGDIAPVSGYPGFVFRKQGPFSQLDLGINFSKDAHKDGWGYVVGGWYRGMFISSSVGENVRKQDALVALGGITMGDLTFTYSYDIILSPLSPYAGGTHELSIVFENNLNKSDSRKGGIANPIYLERFPNKGARKK